MKKHYTMPEIAVYKVQTSGFIALSFGEGEITDPGDMHSKGDGGIFENEMFGSEARSKGLGAFMSED